SSGPVVPAGSVKASHILIKHCGSRKPSSWRGPAAEISRRSRDEAVQMLQRVRQGISSPADFAAAAQQHSECSSAKRDGDLGVFGRGAMQRPFEEATFALRPWQISGVVDTESGVHVIMRTG
ncbi:unnamed protein product, partial [Phaeothamnion confervicola]